MEFEDEDRDEEEVEDDDNDNHNHNHNHNEPEPETMTLLTPPTYHIHHHHNNNNTKHSAAVIPRYRECLKNHAVNIGGHAVDGCGEFMPAGPDGTIDALKCAACNCHRNFHRKENVSAADNHFQLTLYHPPPPHVYQIYRPAAVPSPAATPTTPTTPVFLPPAGGTQLTLPAEATVEEQVTGGMMAMTMTTTSSSGKKRQRTKFSQEEKDKMLGLAEKLGWKIQKCDENVVQEFCDESGIKRHVLKVWMHNNKYTLGKKPPPC